MDERPKWTPEQLEALEVLRCKGDAENDPALASAAKAVEEDPLLAERLERILEWDARLSEAMSDVPVPPALAEQIIQSMVAVGDPPSPATVPPRVEIGRRRWLSWAAAATGVGVAAILVAVVMMGSRLPTMEAETLRTMARTRFQQNHQSQPGSMVTEGDFPAAFPPSPDLIEVPGTRWRRVPDFGRAEAIAYDIPMGPNQSATIYVIRCRSSSLPNRPPRPPFRTQNLAIAAWQADGLVYVAVVQEGRNGVYEDLLRSMSGRLT